MEIEKADINSIIPYALNTRDHGSEQIDRIANSIADFGFNQPIVVDENNIIIVGHGRFAAAKKLGLVEVPIVRKADLTETWNFENLGLELSNLEDCDFDISTWGLEDLLELVPAQELEVTEDDFEPVLEQPAYIKLGDIISLGEHRVMCGDSTKAEDVERLMNGEFAQLVVTDPPYGVDYQGGVFSKREKLDGDETADLYGPILKIAYEFSDAKAAVYLWHSDGKVVDVFAALDSAKYVRRITIIWNKNIAQFGALSAQYKQKHEPCHYLFKKGQSPRWFGPTNETTVWDINRNQTNEHHPTEKPIGIMARPIQNSSEATDIILDLFLGSGTTLIAAEQLNRKCYGMEISPLYCQVIIDRYKTHCITANKPFICKINGEDFDSIRL